MDKKLLGKRINMARKERGWTGERLAEACSINATYLRQIEAGTKVPSLPVFVSLCQALNVSPTYLLVEVVERHRQAIAYQRAQDAPRRIRCPPQQVGPPQQ